MKKIKTSDGYEVYRIKHNKTYEYLADITHYKEEILKLLDILEELKGSLKSLNKNAVRFEVVNFG